MNPQDTQSSIARYQPSLEEKSFYAEPYAAPCMSESSDGDYIRYQDHQSVVARMNEQALNLSRRIDQLEERLWTELDKSNELISSLTLLRRAAFSVTSSIGSCDEKRRLIDVISSTPEQCAVAIKAEGYSIGFADGYNQCKSDSGPNVALGTCDHVLKVSLLKAKAWMMSQLNDTKERMLCSICEMLERHHEK